ncbi:MAG: putative phosphoribosyl transferase [Promethearchaeota archaeon]|nr:MAG: putative phosphoribosyl transferase [Candidatus Lokiarchaeota archaeon]
MVFERYDSRFEAGTRLAKEIEDKNKLLYQKLKENPSNFFCFAIPNGGVPVAEGFCSKFNLKYELLIVRKIKIPYNPEAGFGSITTDGTVLLNKNLLRRINLTDDQIQKAIETTKREILERLKYYEKKGDINGQYEALIKNHQIFMIDDGLASGFTMKAAIKMVKKYDPEKIYVSVPTSPLSTVKRILPGINEVFCPNIREVFRFAVADAYKNWYDLSEDQVRQIIKKSKNYFKETT